MYHVQLNVADATVSVPFYEAVLGYFEYRVVVDPDRSKLDVAYVPGAMDVR